MFSQDVYIALPFPRFLGVPTFSWLCLNLSLLFLPSFFDSCLLCPYLSDTNSNEVDAGRLQASNVTMHQMPNFITFRDKLPSSITYVYSNPFDFLAFYSALSQSLLRRKAPSFSQLHITQSYAPHISWTTFC